ncbi:MAG: hypothetical protein KJ799_03590 [Bacteroidetes bacterium]|nr:hypothetical protein [Bacteroidota bacterium]
MKRQILFISMFFFIYTCAFAQFSSLKQNEGMMSGGVGMSYVDDKPYFAFHFQPELAFANMGLGLDLNLEISPAGKINPENFNEFSDYASIIRYFRYGSKGDPAYFRIGALDYATLGHGSIMYAYNNSASYDARKIGVEFDVDFNEFGFESVYGTFGEAGVFGVRGYVRPLRLTALKDIPIISNLEVGATYSADFNQNAGVYEGNLVDGKFKAVDSTDAGVMNIIGFDLGLPILKTSWLNLDLYYDFVKFVDFGSGSSAGFIARFNALGAVNVTTKLERRFNGDKYIPSYFNSFYEIERFRYDGANVRSKVQFLDALQTEGNGYYGELMVSLLNTFNIIGSYQRLDKDSKSGILHLVADAQTFGSYVVRAGYDKVRIKSEADLFTLDDRSYLFAEVGYKPYSFMIVSMVYHYTFTPTRDKSDNITGYKPQKRIEPRVTFVYPFNM